MQRARFGATRVVTGALAVAGTVVVFKVAMSVDPYLAAALVPALVVLMFAVAAVLAPLFTMIGVRVVALFTGRFGATGYLADMNPRSRTRRLASAVTPIVLAIGIAGIGPVPAEHQRGRAEPPSSPAGHRRTSDRRR